MDEKCARCGHFVPSIDEYECMKCERIFCPDCWNEIKASEQEDGSDVCGECFRNERINKRDEELEERMRE